MIFPYIVTGYLDQNKSKAIVEITDYIPSQKRPRFTLKAVKEKDCLFAQVKSKFEELWSSKDFTERH